MKLFINVVVLALILSLLISKWHDLILVLSGMPFIIFVGDKWFTKRGRKDDDKCAD